MYRNSKHIMFLVAFLSVCGVGRAQMQGAVQDDTDTRLKMRVHLSLGKTTVAKAVAALSAQAGLTVTAADYLRQRTLMVQLDNVSASGALAALAELNDWTWYETEPDHILLTRRKIALPPDPDNMAQLVQVAMPADLREYLGIPRPVEDVRQIVHKPRAFDGGATARGMAGYLTAVARLLDTLDEEKLTRESLPYRKLTGGQRDDVLALVVYNALTWFGQEIVSNRLVYELDPSNCELSILPTNQIGVSAVAIDKTRTAYGFAFTF